MRSLTQNRKGMVGGLAAIVLSGSLFMGQSNAATVIAGGEIPLINTLSVFGASGFDLTIAGDDVVVASFVISNNSPNAFTFTLGLTNGGRFSPIGDPSVGVDWATPALRAATAQPTGSALGTGATALVTTVTPTVGTAAPAAGEWDAVVQTTATTNYKVELITDWVAATTLLAGTYTEIITASLTAQM